jgi:hypothetical protein
MEGGERWFFGREGAVLFFLRIFAFCNDVFENGMVLKNNVI